MNRFSEIHSCMVLELYWRNWASSQPQSFLYGLVQFRKTGNSLYLWSLHSLAYTVQSDMKLFEKRQIHLCLAWFIESTFWDSVNQSLFLNGLAYFDKSRKLSQCLIVAFNLAYCSVLWSSHCMWTGFPSTVLVCSLYSIEITGRALSHDHEQSLESIHADFWKIWERYCVNDLTSPSYGRSLLNAVLNINAAHAPLWHQMKGQASYVLVNDDSCKSCADLYCVRIDIDYELVRLSKCICFWCFYHGINIKRNAFSRL